MRSFGWSSRSLARNPGCPSAHFAFFHSTSVSLAKWKSKWDDKGEVDAQKPSKTHIRYAVRQKRADTKKALKDFLLYGKSPKTHGQDEDSSWGRNANTDSGPHDFGNRSRSKSCGKNKPHSSANAGKGNRSGSKRWHSKWSFCDDDGYEHPDATFRASFGGHRCFTFTWTSQLGEDYQYSTGFEWRNESRSEKAKQRLWSESDVDEELGEVGSHSHRVALGLPPTGPLKLDEVKSAFRASALKWHPDRNQGPSQAIAETKFKLCVDAYNSLCDAFKCK